MALYTETLQDWLNNGFSLPTSFDLIQPLNETNFSDLFLSNYGEWEIGFETEEMFQMKLELKSNLVVPLYVKKIEMIDAEIDKIFENKTVRRTYLNNVEISTLTDDNGNSAESVETQNSTETINAINAVQKRLNSVYQNLLDEFKSLFMGLC